MTNRVTTLATGNRPVPARAARPAPGSTGPVREPALTGPETGEDETVLDPQRLRPVRGRHRRPRPRRVLFAVGGLALAAGALSFVRMAPVSVLGGGGSAEAESRAGAAATDTAGDAVTTVEAVPSARPEAATATAPMGGASASPTPGVSLVPTPLASTPASVPPGHGSTPVTSAPDATGIPSAPRTTSPPAPPTTPAAPRPTPTTTTHAPDPQPEPPEVCVPIVGICVNALGAAPGVQG
jgi:hypothetical protein